MGQAASPHAGRERRAADAVLGLQQAGLGSRALTATPTPAFNSKNRPGGPSPAAVTSCASEAQGAEEGCLRSLLGRQRHALQSKLQVSLVDARLAHRPSLGLQSQSPDADVTRPQLGAWLGRGWTRPARPPTALTQPGVEAMGACSSPGSMLLPAGGSEVSHC